MRFLVDEVGASSALGLPLNIVVLEIYLIYIAIGVKKCEVKYLWQFKPGEMVYLEVGVRPKGICGTSEG